MRKTLSILFVAVMAIFLSACGSNTSEETVNTTEVADDGFIPAEYISTSGSAQPGEETRIQLEDGAAIVVPSNSIDNDVSFIVERSPEKAKTLPPLGDNVVQLGDFYNFEVTEGEIIGPVDLVLPFDEALIPREQGVLVFGYPTEDGWEYIPVEAQDDKVTLYTAQVGDPLIAWHFVETDLKNSAVCDPKIPLSLTQNGESFLLQGKLDVRSRNILEFFGGANPKPAASVRVHIKINQRDIREQGQYIVETDENGVFSLEINSLRGLKEGWNWVFVNADCESLFEEFAYHSEGYAEFKYEPEKEVEETQEEVVETVPEEEMPEGAILLPDFVGKSLDEAEDWLDENGFGYITIDGSSYLDMGLVYHQAPSGGSYKVPHRTIVLLNNTASKIEDPFGCAEFELTSAEMANCLFTGTYTSTVLYEYEFPNTDGSCKPREKPSGNPLQRLKYIEDLGKVAENTYCLSNCSQKTIYTDQGYILEQYDMTFGTLHCRILYSFE
ncbi:MAG: PASTA domain-containing protein [Anaerolineae bacterium]|nr:PASTA domain-containing protein [Anaerolineae bacterium]MBT7190021.1 PASTA domain-containing protein [Anaerolineae bacterium]MBT7990002.1 PASTA domain-containing protein [Anaerolineae bacterium]